MKLRSTVGLSRAVVSSMVGLLLLALPCAVLGEPTPSKNDEAIAAFDKAVAAAKEELVKSLTTEIVAAADPTAVPPAFKFADPGANAALADFAKGVAAAKEELIKKLEGRLGELTKAGNLDEAVKVRDAIAKLKVKPAAAAAATAPKNGAPFLVQKDIVGIWTENNGTAFVLAPDGTFTYANGAQSGVWKSTDSALIFTWAKPAGRVDTYNVRDGNQISGDSSRGHKVGIKKVN